MKRKGFTMTRENERESQKGKRHITPLTVSLIAIAVIMVAAACIVVSICRKDEPKITNTFIDSKLETASELVSAKMIYNGLIEYSDNKIPYINEEAFSMIYRAEVTAGIEMSEVDVEVKRSEVIITVPKTKITNISIDEDSIKFYDKKFALFKGDSKEDVIKAMQQAKTDVEENGNVEELLTQAEEQTDVILKSLFEDSIGDRELVIKHRN